MKLKIVLVISVFYSAHLSAQTNDLIKEKSRENEEKAKSNASSSSSDDDGGTSTDDGYAYYAEGLGSGGLFMQIVKGNNNFIARKRADSIKRVTGGQLELNFGFIPNFYQIWTPRITARAGVFSWDFRIYANKEFLLNRTSSYSTVELQYLQLNLVTQRCFNFKAGIGAMLETYSGTWFNEYTLKLDIYPKSRYRIGGEMRIAPDYRTGQQVRYELNGDLGYQVTPVDKPVALFVQGHLLWARYYRSVEVLTGGLGLCMTF